MIQLSSVKRKRKRDQKRKTRRETYSTELTLAVIASRLVQSIERDFFLLQSTEFSSVLIVDIDPCRVQVRGLPSSKEVTRD